MRPAVLGLALLATGAAAVADDAIEAAGCLLIFDQGVVVNVNRLLNRLQLPVGRHQGDETAEQTAARETLEETGIEVDVGERAMVLNGGRVHLFLCQPRTPVADFRELAAHDTVEVGDVLVINPYTMRNHDGRLIETPWRFPQTRYLLEALYAARSKSP